MFVVSYAANASMRNREEGGEKAHSITFILSLASSARVVVRQTSPMREEILDGRSSLDILVFDYPLLRNQVLHLCPPPKLLPGPILEGLGEYLVGEQETDGDGEEELRVEGDVDESFGLHDSCHVRAVD
jgi:hypothetical protein